MGTRYFLTLATEACCMLRSASCRSMARCSCLRSDWVCSFHLPYPYLWRTVQ